MGESSSSHQNRSIPSSRLGIGLRNSGGEIVEVQGGHIVRSTGRKDRHSKVCTAKGPRDRRVRLAAHTAIQFYDVQDRLGYDRPSKAVDWLIKKAKSAIDELAELPAWNPMTTCSAPPNAEDIEDNSSKHQQDQHQNQQQLCMGGNEMMIVNVQQQENANNSSFLPPSLDSDAIADTIKSFFPMGAASSSSSAMQFQSFQTPPDLRQNQDLRLSLQSFQDPVYPTHHNSNDQPHSQPHSHVLLSGTPLGFDGGWQEHQAELSRFQRFAAWNNAGGDAGSSGSGGYLFNLPPVGASVPQQQALSSHNQFFSSQRGPLQSSNTPSVRAWMDPTMIANAMADHSNSQQQQQHQQHHLHPSAVPIYPSSFSGIGGFSGFHIPARIQGDEEEHDGYSDKPSSASSDSRH